VVKEWRRGDERETLNEDDRERREHCRTYVCDVQFFCA